jgi:hypothetical protein
MPYVLVRTGYVQCVLWCVWTIERSDRCGADGRHDGV